MSKGDLASGDRSGALEHFEAVADSGHYMTSSGTPFPLWADLVLERLREDPTWPPWIPLNSDESLSNPDD